MEDLHLDLDLLAAELQHKITVEDLSLRVAADEIGCSAATLSRMLRGAETPNVPDTETLLRAANWLGKSIGDFEKSRQPSTSSMTEVEVHLRALPDLSDKDKDALVNIVRATHDTFKFRQKKG